MNPLFGHRCRSSETEEIDLPPSLAASRREKQRRSVPLMTPNATLAATTFSSDRHQELGHNRSFVRSRAIEPLARARDFAGVERRHVLRFASPGR